jgi:hypothetical protein
MWHVFIQSFAGQQLTFVSISPTWQRAVNYDDADVDGTLLAVVFAQCLSHTTPTFSLTP